MFTLVVLKTSSTTCVPFSGAAVHLGDTVLGALCVGNATFAKYVKMYPNLASHKL